MQSATQNAGSYATTVALLANAELCEAEVEAVQATTTAQRDRLISTLLSLVQEADMLEAFQEQRLSKRTANKLACCIDALWQENDRRQQLLLAAAAAVEQGDAPPADVAAELTATATANANAKLQRELGSGRGLYANAILLVSLLCASTQAQQQQQQQYSSYDSSSNSGTITAAARGCPGLNKNVQILRAYKEALDAGATPVLRAVAACCACLSTGLVWWSVAAVLLSLLLCWLSSTFCNSAVSGGMLPRVAVVLLHSAQVTAACAGLARACEGALHFRHVSRQVEKVSKAAAVTKTATAATAGATAAATTGATAAAAAQNTTISSISSGTTLPALTQPLQQALSLALRHEAALTLLQQCLSGLVLAIGQAYMFRGTATWTAATTASGSSSSSSSSAAIAGASVTGLLLVLASIALRMVTETALTRCFDYEPDREQASALTAAINKASESHNEGLAAVAAARRVAVQQLAWLRYSKIALDAMREGSSTSSSSSSSGGSSSDAPSSTEPLFNGRQRPAAVPRRSSVRVAAYIKGHVAASYRRPYQFELKEALYAIDRSDEAHTMVKHAFAGALPPSEVIVFTLLYKLTPLSETTASSSTDSTTAKAAATASTVTGGSSAAASSGVEVEEQYEDATESADDSAEENDVSDDVSSDEFDVVSDVVSDVDSLDDTPDSSSEMSRQQQQAQQRQQQQLQQQQQQRQQRQQQQLQQQQQQQQQITLEEFLTEVEQMPRAQRASLAVKACSTIGLSDAVTHHLLEGKLL
jgi:hypothetical protein